MAKFSFMQEATGKHLFKPGQSGNPSGRPKGAINVRNRQWAALHESIAGFHTEKFNEALGTLWANDPLVAMRMYLEILNYFKPRLSAVQQQNINAELSSIAIHIPDNIPQLPSNFKDEDNIIE